MSRDQGRRAFLGAGAAAGFLAVGAAAPAAAAKKKAKEEEDIGPGEDLMREHGVLRRILLVYGEVSRRLEGSGDLDVAPLQSSAALVRRFVEDYHERQEEELVFPRFERAHKLVELVGVLRAQHQAGRKLTDRVRELATAASVKDPVRRRDLGAQLQAFVRMYEPHAAREDTVLFPALHELVSPHEYDALGEDFERREHQLFGQDGFEHAVAEIDAIEKTLGIEDLASFTPRV
jgi:hemerythrin-like domain-containing protein